MQNTQKAVLYSGEVLPNEDQGCFNDFDDSSGGNFFVKKYHRLRERLVELHATPVPDMAAIDEVMHQLDETHAAFKAQHSSGVDNQRY